jgi:hypothetical protein
MKIFPHRLAQEEDEGDLHKLVQDTLNEHLKEYLYAFVSRFRQGEHFEKVAEFARKKGIHLEYLESESGDTRLYRVPLSEHKKLPLSNKSVPCLPTYPGQGWQMVSYHSIEPMCKKIKGGSWTPV